MFIYGQKLSKSKNYWVEIIPDFLIVCVSFDHDYNELLETLYKLTGKKIEVDKSARF